MKRDRPRGRPRRRWRDNLEEAARVLGTGKCQEKIRNKGTEMSLVCSGEPRLLAKLLNSAAAHRRRRRFKILNRSRTELHNEMFIVLY